MRSITKIAVGCLMLASFSSAYAAQTVQIVVRVPADTPREPVYVAGSLASVGGWKADGVKLARQPDKTYTGNIDLEPRQRLNFKITRGSWQTVEKNADGSERANRTVVVDAATKQIDVTVERWASDGRRSELASTVVGNLKLHKIDSRVLKQSRTIRVWLPPGYDADVNVRYSVLYMHDGQNCFDRATSAFGSEWEIDETLTKLMNSKRLPPMIVVGIDNGFANRINEFTYNADSERGGGKGSTYAEFLLTEVKPFVDKTYRTQLGRAHTFLGGSSLGGLISLEIARRHPDTFGGVIAMSPAILWANESMTRDVERDAGGLIGARIWIDMGSRESIPLTAAGMADNQSQRFVAAVHRLDEALAKHRIDHRLVIDDQHAEHNEPAWASRFPQAIAYITDVNPGAQLATAQEKYLAGDLNGALQRLEPLLMAAHLDQPSKQRVRELASRVLQLRGEEHFRRAKIAESIADFDRQVKLQPDQAAEHWQRGIAYYYAGEYEKGARQFELHQTVNPQDVENAAWHFLCVARAPKGSVEAARKQLIPVTRDSRIPMAQIRQLFAGKITPKEVLRIGEDAGGPAKFYADLYVGLYYEARNLDDDSLRLVARAADNPAAVKYYMGDVARVHVILRTKAASSTQSRDSKVAK